MLKTKRILAMTAVAVVAAQAGFAQTTTPTAPMTPAPINLDFLGTLFSGGATPDEAGIRDAFGTAGLTVERYRVGADGNIRVRATTADGQEVRVRIQDGEVRYSLRSGADSTGDNGPTSDDNGPTSDSNGADTRDNTRDGNGGDTRGGNGGNSGGGNGGNS